MLKFIIILLLSTRAFAENTLFMKNDSFFYGRLLDQENTENTKENVYEFAYALNPATYMLCGYEGISYLNIETDDDSFEKFLKWSSEYQGNKQHPTPYYFICSVNYDINKYSIFLRYNDTAEKGPSGGGDFLRESKYKKLQKEMQGEVPALKTSKAVKINDSSYHSLEVTVNSIKDVKIYFFDSSLDENEKQIFNEAGKAFDAKQGIKSSSYFTQYYEAKEGLKLYEYSNGKVFLLESDGEKWIKQKEIELK